MSKYILFCIRTRTKNTFSYIAYRVWRIIIKSIFSQNKAIGGNLPKTCSFDHHI